MVAAAMTNMSMRATAPYGNNPGFFTYQDLATKQRCSGSLLDPLRTQMVNGKLYQYIGAIPRPDANYAWEQHALPHEVGHMLGLDHVNESASGCQAQPNSHICYGGDMKTALNIMGEGDALDLADAAPWLKRIARHALHQPCPRNGPSTLRQTRPGFVDCGRSTQLKPDAFMTKDALRLRCP